MELALSSQRPPATNFGTRLHRGEAKRKNASAPPNHLYEALVETSDATFVSSGGFGGRIGGPVGQRRFAEFRKTPHGIVHQALEIIRPAVFRVPVAVGIVLPHFGKLWRPGAPRSAKPRSRRVGKEGMRCVCGGTHLASIAAACVANSHWRSENLDCGGAPAAERAPLGLGRCDEREDIVIRILFAWVSLLMSSEEQSEKYEHR